LMSAFGGKADSAIDGVLHQFAVIHWCWLCNCIWQGAIGQPANEGVLGIGSPFIGAGLAQMRK